MRYVEHSRFESAPSVEPLETLVELARTVGAHGIASAAKSLEKRLHHARTFIAIMGTDGPMRSLLVNAIIDEGVLPLNIKTVDSIPIVVRYGRSRRARIVLRSNARRDVPLPHLDRFISTAGNFGNHRGVVAVEITAPARVLRDGICLVVGLPSDARPPPDLVPRIDAAIVASASAPGFDDDSAPLIAALQPWSDKVATVRVPHVDDELVEVLCRLAIRAGLTDVERLHDQEMRRLCLWLEHHVLEQRTALECSEGDLARQQDALEACQILADHLESDRATLPDEDRLALERSLATERTKFLMSVKADALAEFASRFAAANPLRRELAELASITATEIASNAIDTWRRSLGSVVDASMVAMGNRLIGRARASFGPLMDCVPALAMLSVEIPPSRPVPRMKMPPVRILNGMSRLRDRIRTAASARRCAEQRGLISLVEMLDASSHDVVAESLNRYDLATREICASLPKLLDQLAETTRRASSRARDARSSGPAAILDERNRIEGWLARLTELAAQL